MTDFAEAKARLSRWGQERGGFNEHSIYHYAVWTIKPKAIHGIAQCSVTKAQREAYRLSREIAHANPRPRGPGCK